MSFVRKKTAAEAQAFDRNFIPRLYKAKPSLDLNSFILKNAVLEYFFYKEKEGVLFVAK